MAKYDHDDLRDRSIFEDNTVWKSPPPAASPAVRIETEPMRVLRECIDLMDRKGSDYQNPNSQVKQAMYYPNGILTLMDIIQAKRLRLVSLIEAHQTGAAPKNESIEDSFKDLINYAAFAVAWCRGRIDGQDPNSDILNKKKPIPTYPVYSSDCGGYPK